MELLQNKPKSSIIKIALKWHPIPNDRFAMEQLFENEYIEQKLLTIK